MTTTTTVTATTTKSPFARPSPSLCFFFYFILRRFSHFPSTCCQLFNIMGYDELWVIKKFFFHSKVSRMNSRMCAMCVRCVCVCVCAIYCMKIWTIKTVFVFHLYSIPILFSPLLVRPTLRRPSSVCWCWILLREDHLARASWHTCVRQPSTATKMKSMNEDKQCLSASQSTLPLLLWLWNVCCYLMGEYLSSSPSQVHLVSYSHPLHFDRMKFNDFIPRAQHATNVERIQRFAGDSQRLKL